MLRNNPQPSSHPATKLPLRGTIFSPPPQTPTNMSHLLNRVRVYTLYFYEYLRYAEFASAINAILYMLTRKSYSPHKQIKTSLGLFETRKGTLDFQYINYAYEVDLKHFIEKQKFDVFFDVGACLGEYCVWLGHKGYRCFAFEPVRESFDMIRNNIQLNKLDQKVTALNYGLGSKYSIEHFKLHATNPGSNMRVDKPGDNTQRIEIFSLDDVYKGFRLPRDSKILMKVDVEGMEVEMLKGARKFLQAFDDVTLIIEEKISGMENIRKTLDSMGRFEYGVVDDMNIYARKLGALES